MEGRAKLLTLVGPPHTTIPFPIQRPLAPYWRDGLFTAAPARRWRPTQLTIRNPSIGRHPSGLSPASSTAQVTDPSGLARLERIRIGLLARSFEVGGAEVQLVALAKALDPTKFEVVVYCLYRSGALLAEIEAAGVPVISIEKRSRWDLVGPLGRLSAAISDHRTDVVHSFLTPPNLLGAAAKVLGGRFHLVWGYRASNMDLARYDWSFRAADLVERRLSSLPIRIVANSHAGRTFGTAHGLPAERMLVIPNGIDTVRFRPDAATRRRVRNEFGITDEHVLAGLVARMDPMKDHPTFLRAAAAAAARDPRMRFLCVGSGPKAYVDSLRGQAAELGLSAILTWTGTRRDMPDILNALDIAALSSAFGEGFPNVVGEAMACGVPCAVTDVGDAAMVVGNCGMVVPPGDPPALAEALIALAARQRTELATTCRDRVVDHFSLGTMVRAHEDLYRQIVQEDL